MKTKQFFAAVKLAERELRCPRACLSNRDDLPVSRPNRFDRPVLARGLRIDKLDVVLRPDSGGVAHLERDLPGVFRLLQAVAAEAVPERVTLLFHIRSAGRRAAPSKRMSSRVFSLGSFLSRLWQ